MEPSSSPSVRRRKVWGLSEITVSFSMEKAEVVMGVRMGGEAKLVTVVEVAPKGQKLKREFSRKERKIRRG